MRVNRVGQLQGVLACFCQRGMEALFDQPIIQAACYGVFVFNN